MKSLITPAILLGTINLFCSCNKTTQQPQRPNVVVIYADDMGYGDISCQNKDAKLKTPNIDKLASEGVRFTDAHSSSGICSPSRFALLTGQYHWRRMHDIVWAFGPSVFKQGEYTVPKMMKQQGYTTAAIGKWHLGWNWEYNSEPQRKGKQISVKPEQIVTDRPINGGPVDQGFDYYFGDGTINFPPYAWVENNRFVEAPTVPLDLKGKKTLEGHWEFRKGPMVEDWDPYQVLPTLTKKAEEYISNQKADKPFFLYFALPCPHAPIIPNEEFRGKSNAGAYGDFVVQTDYVVGRVLKALEDANLSDNTLIIFSADNGPELYAYDRIKNYKHRSMGELRGLKRDTWEGGHRVPFIVKWPGKVKKGVVSNEIISQIDIAATLADITGYNLQENDALDSHNLKPLLLGKSYEKPLREATVQNTFKDRYAIRQGDWVLIDCFSGEHTRMPKWYGEQEKYESYDKTNPGLLYNLADDPSQHHNLYSKYPEKVKELQKLLHQYRTEGRTRK
ncbi:arylsulfatase [Puteibacter caeruleilacunae]|nr:arylsulfatase [Puteibacter caeruleilacunae]